MHLIAVLQLLALLLVANGSPVLGKKILGPRLAWPLDGGALFIDGQPLLGKSKTVRGVLLGIGMPTICAPLLGLHWTVGLVVGGVAMASDLASSFVKRRLNLRPSDQAIGLDQIPESLFPLLACRSLLPLSLLDVALGTAIFFIGELVLSRFLYKIHLRDRPY